MSSLSSIIRTSPNDYDALGQFIGPDFLWCPYNKNDVIYPGRYHRDITMSFHPYSKCDKGICIWIVRY